MKRSYIVAIVLALASAGWIISGQFGSERDPVAAAPAGIVAEEKLPQVRVRQQTAESRIAEIVLRGRTEAVRSVDLAAETRGTIEEIPVVEGAAVKAGDVVARLAQDDRLARLAQTKALLRQRQIEFEAATKLAKKGYRSETSVAEAEAHLEEARAAVKSMEIDLGYTTIAAPFDGVIDRRHVELGDFVDIGDPVAMIVDLDPVLVVAQVSEHDIGRVQLGMTATARLVTGREVTGVIRYVSAVADEVTRTFKVELEIANADRSIPQGVSSELRLALAEQPAHRVSPAILSLADDGVIGVKIVDQQNVVQFVPVTIVADDPLGVWIAGLPPVVTFITVGQDFVRPGQKVDPVAEAAPAT